MNERPRSVKHKTYMMVLLVSERVGTVGMTLRGPAWILCLFRYPAGSYSQNALVRDPLWQRKLGVGGGGNRALPCMEGMTNHSLQTIRLSSACSPLPAYCGVNGQHSLKKGDGCEKEMRLREEEKNRVISFSCGCLLDLWMILLDDLKASWWSHSLQINHWFSPIRKHWLINYGTYITHIFQPDGLTTTLPFPSNASVM